MSGLLVFHTWGDSRNLPEDQCTPVTQDTISTFIMDLAGAYAGDTIANYVQGLRAWHRIYNIPWNIDELHIHTMLKGARKVTPEAAKLPKQQPLLVEDIVAVHTQLDLTQPLDMAVFTCLTTTFFTIARLGKFTVKNLTSFNIEAHIKIMDIQWNVEDRSGNKVTTFHLPQTKIVPKEKGSETVFWAHQEGPANPKAALLNHLEVN